MKFVLGEYLKPSKPISYDKWERCNDAIISWILVMVSVSTIFHIHILHSKDLMAAGEDIAQYMYRNKCSKENCS